LLHWSWEGTDREREMTRIRITQEAYSRTETVTQRLLLPSNACAIVVALVRKGG
jgi:hypothetical protein